MMGWQSTTKVFFGYFAALLVLSVSVSAADRSNRWAILIGIDDYIEAQDLKYCGADQLALKERLVTSGFNERQVFVLHDKATDRRFQPTGQNISKQIQLILGFVERGDILLLSFSGHGVHIDGKSYLCPNDTDLDRTSTMIEVQRLYESLKRCPASLKVMLVDACRNDPRLGSRRSLEPGRSATALARSFQEATPEGIVLLNSCSPGEISFEEAEWGHGVFMHHILQGLDGSADENNDSKVSLKELAGYANLRTKLHVHSKYNDSQRPFITNEATLDALDFSLDTVRLSRTDNGPTTTSESMRVTPVPTPVRPQETLTNSIGMTLKLIPAGEFMMGSPNSDSDAASDEHPQHRVRISRPFYLQTTEVTQGQWQAVMGTSPWSGEILVKEGSNYPATYVSWDDAVEFCRRLSRKDGAEYRLPTEAEWEYACRAGRTTAYSFGDSASSLRDFAWYDENAWDVGERYTHLVGQKRANDLGLYDMHGNVWEWCSDWYGEDYYRSSPAADPTGPVSGSFRVDRGGSWGNYPQYCRSAFRTGGTPGDRDGYLGFRVLRSSVK